MAGSGGNSDAGASHSQAYGWYIVVLLTAAYLFAFVDRQILSLLVEPIKQDLGISDTRIGMLQGLAFGLFYTIAGVPLGYAADRVSRRALLTVSVLTWSMMTAACGLAANFSQLLSARIGVSIGEAALGPTAVPLIRDVIEKSHLARATSIYMLGIPLGSGLAVLLGATLLPVLSAAGPTHWPLMGVLKPWQATFVAVALPGFIIGLAMLTIRDPARSRLLRKSPPPAAREVFSYIKRHWRTFLGFGLPGIAATMMTFGIGFWIPAVFSRSYGLSAGGAAGYLRIWGLLSLTLGVAGALTGGMLADRVRRHRVDGYVILAAISVTVSAVSYGSFTLAPTPGWALVVLAPAAFAGIVPPVMAAAAAIELAPARMRSFIAALWSPLFTLIGVGFGPAIVAIVTIGVFHRESALRSSIPLVALVLGVLAVPLLLAVRGRYRMTVADAEAFDAQRPLPITT